MQPGEEELKMIWESTDFRYRITKKLLEGLSVIEEAEKLLAEEPMPDQGANAGFESPEGGDSSPANDGGRDQEAVERSDAGPDGGSVAESVEKGGDETNSSDA